VFETTCTPVAQLSQQAHLAQPITLSHVSRRWRRCVLDLARLWSINVFRPSDNIEAATAALDRSRTAPWGLFILWEMADAYLSYSSPERLDALRVLFQRFADQLYRVNTLCFGFGGRLSAECTEPFLRILMGGTSGRTMPALLMLAIRSTTHNEEDVELRSSVEFGPIVAPKLRHLKLDQCTLTNLDTALGTHSLTFAMAGSSISATALRKALRSASAWTIVELGSLNVVNDLAEDSGHDVVAAAVPTVTQLVVDGDDAYIAVLPGVLPFDIATVSSLVMVSHGVHFDRQLPASTLAVLSAHALPDVSSLHISSSRIIFDSREGLRRGIGTYDGSMSYTVMRHILHDARTALFRNVKSINLNLRDYAAFLDAAEDEGGGLPELVDMRVRIEQQFVNASPTPGQPTIVTYFGERVPAPKLRAVEVELVGDGRPTMYSAIHFARLYDIVRPDRQQETVGPELVFTSEQTGRAGDLPVEIFQGHLKSFSQYYSGAEQTELAQHVLSMDELDE